MRSKGWAGAVGGSEERKRSLGLVGESGRSSIHSSTRKPVTHHVFQMMAKCLAWCV